MKEWSERYGKDAKGETTIFKKTYDELVKAGALFEFVEEDPLASVVPGSSANFRNSEAIPQVSDPRASSINSVPKNPLDEFSKTPTFLNS